MPSRLALSTIALSLAHVWSYRQKVMTEQQSSVLSAVDAVSAFLQRGDFVKAQNMIQQIVGVTPDAEDDFKKIIGELQGDIEGEVMSKIKAGHEATQAKINKLIEVYTNASGTVDQMKKSADQADQQLFECIAKQQQLKQATEAAEKHLADSRSSEDEACQLQQDNSQFEHTMEDQMKFECDLGDGDSCDQQYANMVARLDKIDQEARRNLAFDQEKHAMLEAACNKRREETVQAQSALKNKESAFANQAAQCQELLGVRTGAICSYGTAMQSKCAAEQAYKDFEELTRKAKDPENAESEPDRIAEWMSASTTHCMAGKIGEKGLSGPLNPEDMRMCSEQARAAYAEQVGTLDYLMQQLSTRNVCVSGPITFFNGQEWKVPAPDSPSSAYTRVEFKPVLQLQAQGSLVQISKPTDDQADHHDPCVREGISTVSCECFVLRDSNFCNTCSVDCGPCKAFCSNRGQPSPFPFCGAEGTEGKERA